MNEWLSTREAMEYVNRSEATLYRWKREGKLQTKKLHGQFLMITRDSLNKCVGHNIGWNELSLYVIKEQNTNFVTIGMTKNIVLNELEKLQKGNPRILNIVRQIDGVSFDSINSIVNTKLNDYHVVGDWFEIPNLDVIDNAFKY